MANMEKQNSGLSVLRWIARVWGGLYALFLLLFMLAYIINPSGNGSSPTLEVWIGLLFMPVSISVGMILAWKWERLGALITIAGLIGFHVTMKISHGKFDFIPLIDSIIIPAVLFLIYWYSVQRMRTT